MTPQSMQDPSMGYLSKQGRNNMRRKPLQPEFTDHRFNIERSGNHLGIQQPGDFLLILAKPRKQFPGGLPLQRRIAVVTRF